MEVCSKPQGSDHEFLYNFFKCIHLTVTDTSAWTKVVYWQTKEQTLLSLETKHTGDRRFNKIFNRIGT